MKNIPIQIASSAWRRLGLLSVLAVLFGTSLAPDATAGPWPLKRGSGFYKLGFGFVRANQFYEPDGNRIAIPTLADYTVSFYGEYGLTDRFTAVAYVPFMQRLTLNRQVGAETGFEFFEGDAVTGPADMDFGLRVGLFQLGNTTVSSTLTLGIPVGDNQQENGLLTGDGEFNQMLSVGVGHSFYPAPAYVSAEAAFNNRNQGFSDEFRVAAEAGYTLRNRVTAIAKLRAQEPLRNGTDATVGGTGGLYASNQRYLVFAFEMAVQMTQKLGFSLSVEGATRGQNVLSAPAYSTGLYLNL